MIDKFKITLLGTGTSVGIPALGKLGWGKCDPNNIKNKRQRCSILIQNEIPNFALKNIPLDDLKTFQQLSMGNAVGVFQLESNGMSSVLKQLQPDKFEEIIAVVALFRPGPMDNIPSFCNRKHGRENIDYIHPMLKDVLRETYGIIVYQEQVMEIAQVLSNYT